MDASFKLYESAHRVASLISNDSNLAAIAANKAVMRTTTINVLDKLDLNYLTSTKQEVRLGAKDIAKRIPELNVRTVNPLLVDMGYLAKGTNSRCPWELTEAGKEYGVYSDTSTNNRKSFQVQSIHWYESIIPKSKSISTTIQMKNNNLRNFPLIIKTTLTDRAVAALSLPPKEINIMIQTNYKIVNGFPLIIEDNYFDAISLLEHLNKDLVSRGKKQK
ncbi:MAG: hypothetical protein HZT40_04050 [Candidatus Thiothrix singaporensis]|uniref:Uncharacterized protein n=1 Tax=Candidatus Thiothrix singaporensis TaxID=2799669 RepID=A0A7L6AP76_9GAMM|nr:MAG: hypothetical protein HZT40_04050 [Candidatus Thiothrix singaporensis]